MPFDRHDRRSGAGAVLKTPRSIKPSSGFLALLVGAHEEHCRFKASGAFWDVVQISGPGLWLPESCGSSGHQGFWGCNKEVAGVGF